MAERTNLNYIETAVEDFAMEMGFYPPSRRPLLPGIPQPYALRVVDASNPYFFNTKLVPPDQGAHILYESLMGLDPLGYQKDHFYEISTDLVGVPVAPDVSGMKTPTKRYEFSYKPEPDREACARATQEFVEFYSELGEDTPVREVAMALCYQGVSLHHLGRDEEARAAFERIISMEVSPEVNFEGVSVDLFAADWLFHLAVIGYDRTAMERWAQHLEENHPDTAQARFARGRLEEYLREGR